MPTSSKLFLAVVLASLGATTMACSRSAMSTSGRTTTTSASLPRADRLPPQTRTLDNTGFVDNGGRSSSETGRSEASGMRATEAGTERPTGTVSGLPLQAGAPRGQVGEGGGSASSVRGNTGPHASGGPPSEAIERLARARCDRETACNRVGTGRSWGSQVSCEVDQRERARADVDSLGCRRGVDTTQLATCLSSIRLRVCDDRRADLDSVAECRTTALCMP